MHNLLGSIPSKLCHIVNDLYHASTVTVNLLLQVANLPSFIVVTHTAGGLLTVL